MSDFLRDTLKATSHLVNTKLEVPLTDTQLLGFIQQAYRTIYLELAEKNYRGLRGEFDLVLPAGTTALTAASTPPLPPTLVEPIRLWEKKANETIWLPMAEVPDHLPFNAPSVERFGWWEWRNAALRFNPSTTDNDVRIHGFVRLADLTMPEDGMGLPDLVNPVSFFAASMALGGNEFYEVKGRNDLLSLANLEAHAKQSTPFRRRRLRRGIRFRR